MLYGGFRIELLLLASARASDMLLSLRNQRSQPFWENRHRVSMPARTTLESTDCGAIHRKSMLSLSYCVYGNLDLFGESCYKTELIGLHQQIKKICSQFV